MAYGRSPHVQQTASIIEHTAAPTGSGKRHTCCVHGCTMTGQHQRRHKVRRRFIANLGRPCVFQKLSTPPRVVLVTVVLTSQTSSLRAVCVATACKKVCPPNGVSMNVLCIFLVCRCLSRGLYLPGANSTPWSLQSLLVAARCREYARC